MNTIPQIDQLRKKARLLSLAIALAVGTQTLFATASHAARDYGYGEYQPITNGQFFANSQASSDLILFQAEMLFKNKNYDAAIIMLRQALEANDDDIDTHKMLAWSLEQKVKKQSDRDPSMFNECVHEWLIVLRNERGPEKGLGLKNGISPGAGQGRYSDEDGAIMARAHLMKLIGTVPKRYETDQQFLNRALRPDSIAVKGKIINKKTITKRNMQEADNGEFTPQ